MHVSGLKLLLVSCTIGTVRPLQEMCINFIKENLDSFEHFMSFLPPSIQQKLLASSTTSTNNSAVIFYPYELISN